MMELQMNRKELKKSNPEKSNRQWIKEKKKDFVRRWEKGIFVLMLKIYINLNVQKYLQAVQFN